MEEIPDNEAEILADAAWASDFLSPEDFAELQTKGEVIASDGEAVALVVCLTPQQVLGMIRNLQLVSAGTATEAEQYAVYSFNWWIAAGFYSLVKRLGVDTSTVDGEQ